MSLIVKLQPGASFIYFAKIRQIGGGIVMQCSVAQSGGELAFGEQQGRWMGNAGPLLFSACLF